jgi:hypothetical protein
MDPSYIMSEYYLEDFRRSRHCSGERYRLGTGSLAVVMIAHTAAGLRRVSAAIERWASGSSEIAVQGQRNVPSR